MPFAQHARRLAILGGIIAVPASVVSHSRACWLSDWPYPGDKLAIKPRRQ